MSSSNTASATSLKDEGNEFFTKGNYEAALAKYLAAIKLDGSQVVFHSNASQCFLKLKRYNEALVSASDSIKIDPTHVKSWVRRANALQGLSRFTEALSDFETALKLEPTNASIINEIHHCKSLAATSVIGNELKTDLHIASQVSSPHKSKAKKSSALEEAKKALESTPTEVHQPAKSFGEFEAHWRTLLPSPELLHSYLLSIEPTKLSSIFKDLMTADMLHSWLETVKILSSDAQTSSHAVLLLDNISKLQRFSLLKMFLSTEQNDMIKTIFSNLDLVPTSLASLDILRPKFL